MYKSFLFLVAFLCLSRIIFSQKKEGAGKIINGLVKSELNDEEYSFINSMQELIALDKEEILKTASKYTDHEKQNINKDLVLLSGYLEMHDLIPYYKGILANEEVENEQKWYIRLALSRMGVVNEADKILRISRNVQNGDDFVYHLLPQLIYTRHPLIFNDIINILLEDKFECTSANLHSGGKINCGYRIIEAFAPVIEDYPYEQTITGDLKADNYPEALSEIKDWFTKHKKDYRIKRDAF